MVLSMQDVINITSIIQVKNDMNVIIDNQRNGLETQAKTARHP